MANISIPLPERIERSKQVDYLFSARINQVKDITSSFNLQINSLQETLTINWLNLPPTERRTVEDTLLSCKLGNTLTWVDCITEVTYKFRFPVNEGYSVSFSSNVATITAKLRMVKV